MGRSEEESARSRSALGLRGRALLFHALITYFSVEEIEALAFRCEIDWSSIPGGEKQAKAMHLIEACEHRGKLDLLRYMVRMDRPTIAI